MPESMREILKKVERGELTPEQAEEYLRGETPPKEMPASPEEDIPPAAGEVLESPAEADARLNRWRLWWLIPLGIGGFILIVGIALITLGYAASSPFWFVCGFFPLFLGLLVVLLAIWSRGARWFHLRVREKGKMQVALSFPVPILLGKWFFTFFGGVIPGLRDQPGVAESMPEMLDAVGKSREPLIVEVNDGDTEVRVYLM